MTSGHSSLTSSSLPQRLPIAILISGRGSNMQVIAQRAASGALAVDVRAVISDKPAAAGLTVARELNIPTHALASTGFADRAAYDAALLELLDRYQPKLIVLAGFMRILTPAFIGAYAGRILNVHPSLLPKYRGLHTHRRALEAGDSVHGVSVHFVTEELDGGPVIIQSQVEVRPDDTETSLSARVQQREHRIYPQAIDWFASGRLTLRDNRAWLDQHRLDMPVGETAMDMTGD
jgi:phosphoribosylglycinamide formyltransferase 1